MDDSAPAPACRTPVLFLLYRRADLAARVLERIRQARPAHLLVAADGPNPKNPGDAARCQEVRDLIARGIDWPCQLDTLYSEVNLGCKRAVSQAMDWAFGRHERLIVLEDDCLPDASFFPFCDEMLERYSGRPEVMQVCGSNLLGWRPEQGSYYFSRFGPIWGWATWRRAWRTYDVEMKSWPGLRSSPRLRELCPEPFEARWRRGIFDQVHDNRIDTWDYQWAYAKLLHGGLSIIPAVNLVSNLGFGPAATHTISAADPRAALPVTPLAAPFLPPHAVQAVRAADQEYLRRIVGLPKTAWSLSALRHVLRSCLRP